MQVLSRHLYEELCDVNKAYLRSQNLIIDENWSDIELGEDQNRIINQLIKNENDIVKAYDKNYQKEKDKVKNILLFLGAAIALLSTGFVLVPLFIASTVVLPILPILLFGFAIVGITELFLNLKINHLKANVTYANNTLDQLKEVDINVKQEIVSTFNHKIQEIKDATMVVHDKIDRLEEKNTQNISQLLAKLGTFSTAVIPIPHIDPANEFHSKEAMSSSPTHQ
ncbi:hypothetical protein A1D18_04835 [Candidatus Rickettsiella isopodorum]|jgi:hypothetical protein|uniref:Uncharacterized protein n=1 Tax=Candidatus Rickettsiella isopodorum TaxID=1225476 RepID=A0A1J8NGZ9_9COXI|nr:hypothetical protein [Candidatus Rickettsiella isopodorum]OIZ94186.1 hypothetical protein A1D18_04835 [Candidatus Rickettsiella isopodorum]